MNCRDRILAVAPFSGAVLRATEPITTAHVEEALKGLAANGIQTTEDARILAYARYHGEFKHEAIRLARTAGLETILRRELSAQTKRAFDEPQRIAAGIENGGSEIGLVRAFSDESMGWGFALLHLVRDADPAVVATVTGSTDDASSLIPMFWLINWAPPEVRATVLKQLLSARDGFTLACATRLLAIWVRSQIVAHAELGFELPSVIALVPKPRGLALFGGLIDDANRWLSFARLRDEDVERAKEWIQRIHDIGRGIVVTPNDVDTVLKAAGARDVQALAMMSRWATSTDFVERTGERIARHALALFKREFATFMLKTQGENLYDAAHPEWVISPLIEALSHVGLSVEDFTEAHRGLAFDAFSRMAHHATWLRDRRRSIALLVVVGNVAIRRSDGALLDAVREAASQVATQPASGFAVFDEATLTSLGEQLGFLIPPA